MFRPASSLKRAILLGLLLAEAILAQSADEGRQAFTAGFDSLSLDLRSNQSIYTNVRITDGIVTIRAGEGTTDETSFEDSRWQFAGGVGITLESAELNATTATFVFANGELQYGELLGNPVEITDYIDEQQTAVRGTAERIVFDNRDQTAALYGQATLALGANEYSGCDLVYHLAEKTFNSGSSECGVLFRIYPDDARQNDEQDSLDYDVSYYRDHHQSRQRQRWQNRGMQCGKFLQYFRHLSDQWPTSENDGGAARL